MKAIVKSRPSEGKDWPKGLTLEELPEPEAVQYNERRRYYAITSEGREALGAEAEALQAAARMAQAVLKTSAQ